MTFKNCLVSLLPFLMLALTQPLAAKVDVESPETTVATSCEKKATAIYRFVRDLKTGDLFESGGNFYFLSAPPSAGASVRLTTYELTLVKDNTADGETVVDIYVDDTLSTLLSFETDAMVAVLHRGFTLECTEADPANGVAAHRGLLSHLRYFKDGPGVYAGLPTDLAYGFVWQLVERHLKTLRAQ